MTDSEPNRRTAGVVRGIFHPVISVSDMDAAMRFYGDILRLKVTFDDMHDPVAIGRLFSFDAPVVHSIVLECSDRSEFELVEFQKPKGRTTTDRNMNDAGIAALALRVAGLDELVGRVHAGGFTLSSGVVEQTLPDGAILRVAVCCGPDNVKVILVEPPSGRKRLASESHSSSASSGAPREPEGRIGTGFRRPEAWQFPLVRLRRVLCWCALGPTVSSALSTTDRRPAQTSGNFW